jgi:uncharacterized protein (TIGR02588 family)
MKNTFLNVDKPSRKRPIMAEWVTFLISVSLLALLVGLVIHSWITQSDGPPILQIITNGEIQQVEKQYYVPFTVTNIGGETAESVQIIGEIEENGRVEQVGDQQIDYLSGGEKQEGAFVVDRDPRQGNFAMRVASYKLP